MASVDGAGADPPAPLIDALAELARRHPRPVVLIDGRSGSGKTTLAVALARALDGELVRMDWLYPGWDGLEAGSRHLGDHLLGHTPACWRAWDWDRGVPGAWHSPDPSRPLIVEGAGALSRANRARATSTIWVEQPDGALRRARALARDGEIYAPHWDRWAEQERAFIAREQPAELADVIVENASWTLRDRRGPASPPPRPAGTGSMPTSTPAG